MKQGNETGSFYSDIKVILPIVVTILAILAAGAAFVACIKRSRCDTNVIYIFIKNWDEILNMFFFLFMKIHEYFIYPW